MARLILFLLLFAALAMAIAAGAYAWRALSAPFATPRLGAAPQRLPALTEDRMPPAIRNLAYVLLFLLLAGLTSGWLGPA